MTPLDGIVADRVRRHGPLPFADVMGAALYDPAHGFYVTGGAAGRRGDFITSPEVGPLFGAVIGRALDAWWRALGEPDPFIVIEAAAGVGTLARTVLAGAPACLPALTYVMVEQSPVLRSRQGDHLQLTAASHALPPAPGGTRDGDSDLDRPLRRTTTDEPTFVSLPDLPAGPFDGVVLANELLDNLPVDLVEWRGGAWHEIRIGLGDDDHTLVEVPVPAAPTLVHHAGALVPEPTDGARIPVATAAAAWVTRAARCLTRGRVVLFDYGDTTAGLAARPATEWLRTYRGHERGTSPLVALGSQDITCEVPFDQVAVAGGVAQRTLQAEFLRGFGIDGLVDEGRRIWHERAHLGDLAAMKARSRVREAEALLDPEGLGAFWVLAAPIP